MRPAARPEALRTEELERVELLDQALEPLVIGAADLGWRKRAGGAVEQLNAELVLEPGDEFRRLAGAGREPLRRAREAAALEHGDEHAVAVEAVHGLPPPAQRKLEAWRPSVESPPASLGATPGLDPGVARDAGWTAPDGIDVPNWSLLRFANQR